MDKPFRIAYVVIILAPLVLALPFAMDVYVPALPSMSKLFRVDAGEMQLTLTIFMFTAGVIQLFVGPLTDHFGRKPVAYITILLFAIGSFLCAIAQNPIQLILYRIVQASGSCGMLVIAYAIIRDLYHGEQGGKAYSYLNGIIAFSPMFAPFIGSFLDIYLGWPATFLFLLVVALVALLCLRLGLPETLAPEKKQRFQLSIFKEYVSIFRNRLFLWYTLATAAGVSYLYLFCAMSSYIIIRLLHISEAYYGFYFAFMGVSFFVGSMLSGWLIGKIGIYYACVLGFCLTLLGGVIMMAWYYQTGLTINNFIWPMLLIGIGGTICLGAGSGGSMEPFGNTAGAAAALGGGFRFLFMALVGSVAITSHISSTLPLAVPAVIFSVIGLIIFLSKKSTLRFRH